MKFSIITCTYNSEKYLQETIDSVIAQNLNMNIYEHIFIDGFSSDNTVDLINKYKRNHPDKHIYLFQKQARGIYNAMNEGVRQAKGEYITFLNSDDYYRYNTLNDYLNFIEKNGNKDLYYGMNNIVDSNGKTTVQYPNISIYKKGLNPYILAMACYIFQSNTFYKKSLHEKYGLYNEGLKLVSDAEFFIKLAKGNITNIFYDQVIANFRIHDGSASVNTGLQEKENERVRIAIFGVFIGCILNKGFIFLKKVLRK